MNVHSGFIHNPPLPRSGNNPNINWCMDKQISVYQYNEILVFHIKQSATETIRNMDESQKYSAEGKKPDTKE